MGTSIRVLGIVLALALAACGTGESAGGAGGTGTGGTGGSGGTGGTTGTGGSGGEAGTGGLAGNGGMGGMGATGGSSEFCTYNGVCNDGEYCVCVDCDEDSFCSNPANCFDNGNCQAFVEGCVCADCASHPECQR